jgi:histidinol phosphatase-like enzyme (inositol monophosphatase family)
MSGESESRRLLEAVHEAARLAGDVALERWTRDQGAQDLKDDGSPVTDGDRAAERAVREWLERHFPDDGVLGEEFGLTRPKAPRRWTVDPIDGTRNYVLGLPLWGSLVAVCEGTRVLAGAAVFPALNQSLRAAPGLGCSHDGVLARVSEIGDLGHATVVLTDARALVAGTRASGLAALARETRMVRTWGDCVGYLLVATGRAEVMVDTVMQPWDAAPLQPIIEEAGGVFGDFNGRATAFGDGVIATNRSLAGSARRVMGVHFV